MSQGPCGRAATSAAAGMAAGPAINASRNAAAKRIIVMACPFPMDSLYFVRQITRARKDLKSFIGGFDMARTIFASALLVALAIPMAASSQQPPPTAPRGVVPPDQNLPSYIRKLTSFGERAEFSLDSKKVIFLTKTYGDVMEYD